MATATRTHPRSLGPAGFAAVRSGVAALLLTLAATSIDAAAAAQPPAAPGMVRVTIEVELSCPSCALGLERRLNRLEHVASVEVRPDDGRIVLAVESGRRLDLATVRDTVRNAGFIPDGMRVTAVGHITDVNGAPALALSPDFALPLAAGEPTAALVSEGGDRLLTVSGHWNGQPDGARRLQVESFEVH